MSQTIDVSEAVAPVKKVPSWQFSVRSLLILTTVCCAGLAMMAFPPMILIAMFVGVVAMFIFCVTAAIYGRGWIRPFSIVAGATLLLSFLLLIGSHMPPFAVAVFFMVQILASATAGLCGAAAHGFLKKRSGVVPVPL